MNSNAKKTLSVAAVTSMLVTSSVAGVNVKAASTSSASSRIWGLDRYETAAKVAQTGWTSSSDYAIIASGEGYADALCAAPLSKAKNAPILLTQNGDLNANTLNELKRLNVKHVFIVGGEGVVSKKVEDKVKAQVADVQRLAGQDRYETSVKVAEKLGASSKIVLASGEGYADALSAAPVAAIKGMPILLTQRSSVSTPTAEYIKANTGITKTYVIGGYASVSDAAMNSVPGAERLSGADRYATNAAVINNFASDFDFAKAYLALGDGPTGNEFADALTGSALAAKDKAPLIIVGKELSSSTKDLIKAKLTKDTAITTLGGTANISDSLVNDAIALLGTTNTGGNTGGSSGGSSSSKFYLNTSTTSLGTINKTAYITAAGISLSNGTINGDLYVNADNVALSAVTVNGTIYVNPGSNGTVTLDGVTAENIEVLSGATDSIHLKSVTANTLKVKSTSPNVHVKSEGTTVIKSTEIGSSVKLDATSGSFGNITIVSLTSDTIVDLLGSFDKPILVKGNVKLQAAADAIIAGIVVDKDANADGIKLVGNGRVLVIIVKSNNAFLSIDGTIIAGKIIVIDKTKVTAPGKTVEEGTANMTDITADIGKVYTDNIADYIAKHPGLNNYFTVAIGTDAIKMQLNKESLSSFKSAFEVAQNKDITEIESKLTKAQEQLDLHSAYIKIDGLSVRDFLAKLNYTPYINADGSLNVSEIAKRIKDKTLTYDQFRQNLEDRIRANYNTSGASPKLSVSYKGLSEDITTIVKNGKFIYDSTLTRDANITNLVGLGDSTPGTYTVYCGTDYFTVKVLAK